MSDRKIVRAGNWFATEVSNALYKLSGASIAITAQVATVTLASHLLSTGDLVTFSGVTGTGSTALNAATWGPVTVTNSGVYTFPVGPAIVSTSIGGTIVQEKLYFPPAGDWVCVLGANGQVEYNPDNLVGANWGLSTGVGGLSNGGLDATWRVGVATSSSGRFTTDGYQFRFRENGTTATSYFSQVA